LLEQHDDSAGHHVLWVRKDGEVMLTCLPRSNPRKELPTHEHRDMRLRYDTFPVGYGFVGPRSDDGWFMGELFKNMLAHWTKDKDTPGWLLHVDLDTVAPYGRVVDTEEAAEYKRDREENLRRKKASEIGRCAASLADQNGTTSHLNLNNNPTKEQFFALLEQHDDGAGHHVLWVRKDGEVMLTCLPRSNPRKELPTHEHRDMRLRYDTFPVGYGFVGPRSDDDDGWFMGELFKNMLAHWTTLKSVTGVKHINIDSVAPDGRPVEKEESAQIKREQEEAEQRTRFCQSRMLHPTEM
jgi:hypothetical protein